MRQRAQSQHQAASASPLQEPLADEAAKRAQKKLETGSKLPVKVKPKVKIAKRSAGTAGKDDSKQVRKEEEKPPDLSNTPALGSLFGDYASDSGEG